MTNHQRLTSILGVVSLWLLLAWPVRTHPTHLVAFSKRLRVMTYNIHVGVGMDKKLDVQRIAGVIRKGLIDSA